MRIEVPAEVTMKNRPNITLDATPCSSRDRSYEVTYDFQIKGIRLLNDGGDKLLLNFGIICHTI